MARHESDFGLALGVFDGLHLGHQAVLDAARGRSRTGLLTFDPHPVNVLAPERAPRRILTSLAHQELILESLGADFLCVVAFTPAFAAIPAQDFASALAKSGAQRLAAGHDWTFGKGRSGDVTKLATWVAPVPVIKVEPVLQDGLRISSTLIRKALANDDLSAAATYLGRPYSVFGQVKQGRQLGRELGFPTANVDVSQEQLPPNGVYLIQARFQGQWVKGVANVGVRPTVEDSPRRTLEAHLFSESVPACYGWDVEVAFLEKLRGEKKFANIDSLKAQIAQDVTDAKSRN